MSTPIRILLGEKASAHLLKAGDAAFVVVGRASWPDDPKRCALHVVPCEVERANAAVRVAKGEAKISKPKKKPKARTGAP